MSKPLNIQQAAEARALVVALGIAALADWPVHHAGPVLSSPYAGYLYVEEADILLVPTAASLEWQRPIVDKAMREARSDALIVSLPAKANVDGLQLALGRWECGQNSWDVPVELMIEDGAGRWLRSEAGTVFQLVRGRLSPLAAPWRTGGNKTQASRRGQDFLKKLLGSAPALAGGASPQRWH